MKTIMQVMKKRRIDCAAATDYDDDGDADDFDDIRN